MSSHARISLALLAVFFLFPIGAYAALININTALPAALETLPGIGPTKAAAIIAYREANGPFATIENIENVSGIGPATFAKISALITVGEVTATAAPVQPTAPPARSQQVQVVESAVSNAPNASTHQNQTVSAPAASAESAAVGVAQPTMARDAPPPTPSSAGKGFLHSRWLLGLLVVVALAGGAFMIL